MRFSLLYFFLISCVPQGGSFNVGSYSAGGLAPNGTIDTISTSGDQLIINGSNFDGVTAVSITNISNRRETTFKKPFKVLSANATQIIAQSVDTITLPVNTLLSLILSNAMGDSIYSVTFQLQNNAVTTASIKDASVTAAKIGTG